jgi:alginate O-acetyltransferase complex protein AlgI
MMPRRGKNATLTLLSYVFYGWANPLFMVLMFYSTVIDYFCGLTIARHWRKSWTDTVQIQPKNGKRMKIQTIALIVSICSNISLLAFFKYFNFAVENYDAVVAALGFEGIKLDLWFKITLPLGISFYTFQSMSYSIDVYRGDAKAIRNFPDFACYVSMFPQLVAGPIIRFQGVAEQLFNRKHTTEKCARGIAFMCMGLTKKVLLANPCGKIADLAFNSGSIGQLDAWYGVTAYAFQIYFDFSGYSDMAIGLGLMLGFVFLKNFDSPYQAQSITEFWRRWHLSLSSWLRDYLYIPLGGNQKGTIRTYINLAAVMLLGGLWHGAAWNFVIWGTIHAMMLSIERLIGRNSFYRFLPKPFRVLVTFVIVLFAWVFFRASDLPDSFRYFKNMLGLETADSGADLIAGIIYDPYYMLTFCISAVIVWGAPQSWDFTRRITWPKVTVVLGCLLLSIISLTTQSFNPFIYFIF